MMAVFRAQGMTEVEDGGRNCLHKVLEIAFVDTGGVGARMERDRNARLHENVTLP